VMAEDSSYCSKSLGISMNLSPSVSLYLLITTMFVTGCMSDENISGEGLTACQQIRPGVCAQHYKPVCAKRNDGSYKSYPNDCMSCSDKEVIGYTEGLCK